MTMTQRLRWQLEQARGLTEELIKGFTSPEEWTYQVHPDANHALWLVGHLATADDFFLLLMDPSRSRPKEGYRDKFGRGSKPVSDASAYPPVDELLDYLRDRRKALLDALASISDADLDARTKEGAPPRLRDWGSLFSLAAFHEGLHAGQMTVARRALGKPSVMA